MLLVCGYCKVTLTDFLFAPGAIVKRFVVMLLWFWKTFDILGTCYSMPTYCIPMYVHVVHQHPHFVVIYLNGQQQQQRRQSMWTWTNYHPSKWIVAVQQQSVCTSFFLRPHNSIHQKYQSASSQIGCCWQSLPKYVWMCLSLLVVLLAPGIWAMLKLLACFVVKFSQFVYIIVRVTYQVIAVGWMLLLQLPICCCNIDYITVVCVIGISRLLIAVNNTNLTI